MFTTGQLIFGILFALAFIVVLIYAYRKDIKLHRTHYRGVLWVLLAFIGFIGFIISIKLIFK